MPVAIYFRVWLKGAAALLPALLFLFSYAPVSAQAQAPDVASYQISVRLDADARRLQGSETIQFRNVTSQTARELYFHLYPNAFSSPNSTFMKENPAAAFAARAQNNWGGMEVTALQLASGEDLLAGSSVDDTVMKVPLPQPLEPGGSLQMEADFAVKLPRVIARMGYVGDHFTIAQWFPKLAVLMDQGWNAHQYHADSEFFADFGNYRVEITLPDRFVVGASGVPAGEKENGDGTKTLTFTAEGVHDFAWVANPTFREARAQIGGTTIRLLYQADHEAVKDRFMNAAKAAVENFSRWFGPYPYPLLTVADVPGSGGAGMEYPTLVTVSSSNLSNPALLLEEQVTIHEISHQWWYGLVADNEFEEAWLDEGFATYSTRKLVDQLYGADASMARLPGFHLGQLAMDRAEYLALPRLDPVVQDSWKFYDSMSYSVNVYAKAGLILSTVERYLGPETMQEVMQAYFQRYAFRHPTTQDFVDTVRQVSGRDFGQFFRQALYSTAIFDYSVDAPSVAPVENGFRSDVTVRRLGDGVMPVEVVTTFADGQQEMESWDGQAGWQRYRYERPSPAVKVEVDPEHKLLLDSRFANNSYTVWFNAQPVMKWAGDLTWAMQGWVKLLGYLY